MSDDLDALLEQLRTAAEFMATMRQLQRDSETSLRGKMYLQPEQTAAITEITRTSHIVENVKESLGLDLALNTLCERFEEMCRRHRVTMDERMRPGVVRLLSTELALNFFALGGSPKDLIAVTLHNGACGQDLITSADFMEFRDTPSIFRRVAVNNPTDPRGAMRKWRAAKFSIPTTPRLLQIALTIPEVVKGHLWNKRASLSVTRSQCSEPTGGLPSAAWAEADFSNVHAIARRLAESTVSLFHYLAQTDTRSARSGSLVRSPVWGGRT